MLYSEFIDGTKSKDNKITYAVYEFLEKIYDNSKLSKMQIYGYGKALIDCIEKDGEINFSDNVKLEITRLQCRILERENEIKAYKNRINYLNDLLDLKEKLDY